MKIAITPCLWFDREGEEAARLYTSIFPNSRITAVSRYGEGAPLPKGTALTVTFELDGRELMALNGGPTYRLTEAFSLVVHCDTQEEVDHYWATLGAGGTPQQCGWLKDRFGLSWQIVPRALGTLMQDPDPRRAARVVQAMLGMAKLDIAALQRARDETP
jgi:predicted 3-demethylubiquinone-9 3-methyltransferase (glyoxalase superfamily)